MQRMIAVLALAALVAACSEQPTTPVGDAEVPTVTFMQTTSPNDTMPPGTGWTLLFSYSPGDESPATSPYIYDSYGCIGAGPWISYGKWWWWSKDFVVTSNGTMHATQWVTWGTPNGYLRTTDGESWILQKQVQPLIAHWQRQGSEWVAQNSGEQWYVNERTGQRMKETVKAVLHFPEMPSPGVFPNYTQIDWHQAYRCQLVGK